MILGLRTVIYRVPDLEKAKTWYTKAFQVNPYFDEPFYVGFNVGGYELGLLPDEHPSATKTQNILTYWGVENITEAYQRFLDAGAKGNEKPEHVGESIMVATVKDPWDNVIGLIYNPSFKLP